MIYNEDEHEFEVPRMGPIPKIFWSDLENRPFESCLLCHKNFVEHQLTYLIEKAIRGFNGESVSATLFEYAVCMDCAETMNMKLSTTSKANIEQFFLENVDFQARADSLIGKPDHVWLEECLIHKKAVSQEGECQIYAMAHGDQLIYHQFPYMIRTEALNDLMDLISAETLDELDNFKDNLTDGPPELAELLDKAGPRVLL